MLEKVDIFRSVFNFLLPWCLYYMAFTVISMILSCISLCIIAHDFITHSQSYTIIVAAVAVTANAVTNAAAVGCVLESPQTFLGTSSSSI